MMAPQQPDCPTTIFKPWSSAARDGNGGPLLYDRSQPPILHPPLFKSEISVKDHIDITTPLPRVVTLSDVSPQTYAESLTAHAWRTNPANPGPDVNLSELTGGVKLTDIEVSNLAARLTVLRTAMSTWLRIQLWTISQTKDWIRFVLQSELRFENIRLGFYLAEDTMFSQNTSQSTDFAEPYWMTVRTPWEKPEKHEVDGKNNEVTTSKNSSTAADGSPNPAFQPSVSTPPRSYPSPSDRYRRRAEVLIELRAHLCRVNTLMTHIEHAFRKEKAMPLVSTKCENPGSTTTRKRCRTISESTYDEHKRRKIRSEPIFEEIGPRTGEIKADNQEPWGADHELEFIPRIRKELALFEKLEARIVSRHEEVRLEAGRIEHLLRVFVHSGIMEQAKKMAKERKVNSTTKASSATKIGSARSSPSTKGPATPKNTPSVILPKQPSHAQNQGPTNHNHTAQKSLPMKTNAHHPSIISPHSRSTLEISQTPAQLRYQLKFGPQQNHVQPPLGPPPRPLPAWSPSSSASSNTPSQISVTSSPATPKWSSPTPLGETSSIGRPTMGEVKNISSKTSNLSTAQRPTNNQDVRVEVDLAKVPHTMTSYKVLNQSPIPKTPNEVRSLPTGQYPRSVAGLATRDNLAARILAASKGVKQMINAKRRQSGNSQQNAMNGPNVGANGVGATNRMMNRPLYGQHFGVMSSPGPVVSEVTSGSMNNSLYGSTRDVMSSPGPVVGAMNGMSSDSFYGTQPHMMSSAGLSAVGGPMNSSFHGHHPGDVVSSPGPVVNEVTSGPMNNSLYGSTREVMSSPVAGADAINGMPGSTFYGSQHNVMSNLGVGAMSGATNSPFYGSNPPMTSNPPYGDMANMQSSSNYASPPTITASPYNGPQPAMATSPYFTPQPTMPTNPYYGVHPGTAPTPSAFRQAALPPLPSFGVKPGGTGAGTTTRGAKAKAVTGRDTAAKKSTPNNGSAGRGRGGGARGRGKAVTNARVSKASRGDAKSFTWRGAGPGGSLNETGQKVAESIILSD